MRMPIALFCAIPDVSIPLRKVEQRLRFMSIRSLWVRHIPQQLAQHHRPLLLFSNMQQVRQPAVSPVHPVAQAKLDFDPLFHRTPARQNLTKASPTLQRVAHREDEGVLEKSKHLEQGCLADTVGPHHHAQSGDVGDLNIPEAFEVLQADGFDIHEGLRVTGVWSAVAVVPLTIPDMSIRLKPVACGGWVYGFHWPWLLPNGQEVQMPVRPVDSAQPNRR